MAFECPRRSSPPSPMFDADTGCIATDPAPSARRRFRSKTGIENLPANEHAQETPHTPSPTRTTRRIQSGCAGSRPRLRDGMPGSPSQHIDITRAKWIPYLGITGTSLATSIKVGDLFVRPKELQKHLGRYAQRFVSYRDDNVYEFQHIGTATGIRYRGRHFAISTDHQRRLGADGKLGIVCDPGQSMITPSFMRTLNFPNEADREDQHDFTVLEYEPEKYPNRQLSSQFFRVDFDSGVGQAVGRIALNLGYPTRLQNVDYHQRRVDLLVVSSYVELIGK